DGRVRGGDGMHRCADRGGDVAVAEIAGRYHWVAVVRDRAAADDRVDSVRRAVDGGPVYVFADDRAAGRGGVGGAVAMGGSYRREVGGGSVRGWIADCTGDDDAGADRALAGQRGAVRARNRGDGRQSRRAQQPRVRAGPAGTDLRCAATL